MPDDDRFPRGLPPCWRPVGRALRRADAQPVDVAWELARALSDTLRRTGGIPDLPALAAELHEAARLASGQMDFGTAPLGSQGATSDHEHSRLARRVAAVMPVSHAQELASGSKREAGERLAREVLRHLANGYGFDRIVPQLVREGLYTDAEAHGFVKACLAQEPIDGLARRLLKRPSAEGLVAPSHPVRRRTTADLLDVPLRQLS